MFFIHFEDGTRWQNAYYQANVEEYGNVFHFMEQNRTQKLNKRLTQSSMERESQKAMENKQERIRRVRYKATRAATLAAIPMGNVRRIAEQLDTIKNNQKYFIIQNVVEDTLDLTGEVEPITFSGESEPYL